MKLLKEIQRFSVLNDRTTTLRLHLSLCPLFQALVARFFPTSFFFNQTTNTNTTNNKLLFELALHKILLYIVFVRRLIDRHHPERQRHLLRNRYAISKNGIHQALY